MNCPIMRSHRDMEISQKIYKSTPVLCKDNVDGAGKSRWNISFMRMFDMAGDSSCFMDEDFEGSVPLYEGKLIHQYDDRHATYLKDEHGNIVSRSLTDEDKQRDIEICPRYWMMPSLVKERLLTKEYSRPWIIGFRDVARGTDERTLIATALNAANALEINYHLFSLRTRMLG